VRLVRHLLPRRIYYFFMFPALKEDFDARSAILSLLPFFLYLLSLGRRRFWLC